MKYKVLVNNRFGEGWVKGDIVDMDENAARVPLEEGSIELFDKKEKTPKKNEDILLPKNDVKKNLEEELKKKYPNAVVHMDGFEDSNMGLYKCGKCGEKHKKTKNERCKKVV